MMLALIGISMGAIGLTRHVQGEGLVAAMRHVPTLYFNEEFSLSRQASNPSQAF